MTQPSYVPIGEADQVRPAYRLQTPVDWRQDRVAELLSPVHPRGRDLGVPGPDQGYALLVAHELFADRLELSQGITAEDALVGCAAAASARAVTGRARLFQAASHHYRQQRRIVEAVPESTLRLTPDQVRAQLSDWRTLVVTD